MVRTKTKKFRRSRTHGKGKKAGRGAGLRGGRGNAGLCKHKFMYMMKYMPDHYGKHGFKRPQYVTVKDRVINVGQLEERFPEKHSIDLEKEGYDKLLGAGILNLKLKIKVNSASEKAINKIKEKGGEVNLPEVKALKDQNV
jgi:large subunit ribosomal protein L15